MDTENKIKLKGVTIRKIEPDILRYNVEKDTLISHDLIKEIFEIGNSYFPDGKRKVLVIFNSNFIPSKEASDFMVSTIRTERISAEAFCINSSALRVIANFYLQIKRPVIKSKIFDDENLALAWLRNQ